RAVEPRILAVSRISGKRGASSHTELKHLCSRRNVERLNDVLDTIIENFSEGLVIEQSVIGVDPTFVSLRRVHCPHNQSTLLSAALELLKFLRKSSRCFSPYVKIHVLSPVHSRNSTCLLL